VEKFSAKIFKIGINPCVIVPARILKFLFVAAGKSKGPIPVKGKLNGAKYHQTVVKFSGKWRLYINFKMLQDSGLKNGDKADIEIEFDSKPRTIHFHPDLKKALNQNPLAKASFEKLSPYRKKEIIRYIAHLKTNASRIKNIEKAISHLTGKGAFAGRVPGV
jgi:hypothetical protein